jgi:adenylate cyclase class 2
MVNMNTEIEVKFVQVNHEKIRQKLKSLGAKHVHPMRDMRRIIIETPGLKSKNAYIRVRHEGDKVTVTYKQFDELSLSGAREIEITVNDFDSAVALFEAAGLPYRSLQESRRETWQLGDVEVVLDVWPWLDPYIEIEGNSEAQVKDVAKKLGFKWKDAVFGDVMAAYRMQYTHLDEKDTVGNLKEVRFGDPLPDLFKPKG